MNVSDIIAALDRGAQTAEMLSPIAQALGGSTAGSIVGIIASLAATAANVLERIEEGKVVASSNEQAELKAYIERLGRVNDSLAATIANS